MRLPNLSVSDSITNTIRDLDMQRYKLDKQISSGQKITLPEDDGMRLGRVIDIDTEKGKLAQYQRNASYASEFLNAGHLNLDNLRELNQRAQEISRVAGSSLNGPAMETYGNEINQLIEEALNRVNARHRGRSLFAGTQLKPEFGNSEIQLGQEQRSTISLNSSFVGDIGADGSRQIKAGEQVVIHLNGREYVIEATADGLTTDKITELANKLINEDPEILSDFEPLEPEGENYRAFIRGSVGSETPRKSDIKLYSEISTNGDLLVYGTVGKSYDAKAEYRTQWDASHYYPNQIAQKRAAQTEILYPGSSYETLTPSEKKIVDDAVFEAPNGSFSLWSDKLSFKAGDKVFDDITDPDNPRFLQFQDPVKGNWGPDEYAENDFVFHDGAWHKVLDPNGTLSNDVPHNPAGLSTFNPNLAYTSGDVLQANNQQVVVAGEIMKGQFDAFANYSAGDVVHDGSDFYSFDEDSVSSLSTDWEVKNYEQGAVVRHNGIYYEASVAISSDSTSADFDVTNPGRSAKWSSLGTSIATLSGKINGVITNVSADVLDQATNANLNFDEVAPTYFSASPFQAVNSVTQEFFSQITVGVENEGVTYEVIPEDSIDPTWTQEINVGISYSDGTSRLSVTHSDPWKRLERYEMGRIVEFEGRLWESQIIDNFNHKPNAQDSTYWKEIPGGYDTEREDWNLKVTGQTFRQFYKTLDGQLFDIKTDAIDHNSEIMKNTDFSSPEDQSDDDFLESITSQIVYAVNTFDVKGSKSEGMVFFDHQLQEYRLAAAKDGSEIIKNSRVIYGENYETNLKEYNGAYFLLIGDEDISLVDESNLEGNANFLKLEELPRLGNVPILLEDQVDNISLSEGEFIHEANTGKFYVNSSGDTLTIDNETSTIDMLEVENKIKEVPAYIKEQGREWAANMKYSNGDIVLHKGKYYQNIFEGDFDNYIKTGGYSETGDSSKAEELIYPDSTLIPLPDSANSTSTQVANYIWEEIDPLQHVLQFDVTNSKTPSVELPSPGIYGDVAEAKPVVDAFGNIVGLQVKNPGRYIFDRDENDGFIIPGDFTKATVNTGDPPLDFKIIWRENPNDPGYAKIAGFEPLNSEDDKHASVGSAKLGDTFSFATGSKTFLDHRNEKGEIVNVTYMGSENNSEFYVGKDSAISSFLNSADGGTAELGDVVNTLVELRDGLANATPSFYSQEVEDSEKRLIELEDNIIDKMGELTASMVRMETVKAHDEDYFMQLDQRISRDLDIDLSETIMRLSRVSTAYQAAMQVGAQLLNTSLLNYL